MSWSFNLECPRCYGTLIVFEKNLEWEVKCSLFRYPPRYDEYSVTCDNCKCKTVIENYKIPHLARIFAQENQYPQITISRPPHLMCDPDEKYRVVHLGCDRLRKDGSMTHNTISLHSLLVRVKREFSGTLVYTLYYICEGCDSPIVVNTVRTNTLPHLVPVKYKYIIYQNFNELLHDVGRAGRWCRKCRGVMLLN